MSYYINFVLMIFLFHLKLAGGIVIESFSFQLNAQKRTDDDNW